MEIDNIRQAWHWGIEAKNFTELKNRHYRK